MNGGIYKWVITGTSYLSPCFFGPKIGWRYTQVDVHTLGLIRYPPISRLPQSKGRILKHILVLSHFLLVYLFVSSQKGMEGF